MVPSRHFKEYRYNEISTSSQGKLILMMYEGAAKFTKMALISMEKGDIASKGNHIQKAHDIINELSISLDMQKGGEVSMRLERLYQFMLGQLTLANIKSDAKALKSVLKILAPLHEAWEQLFRPPEPAGGQENNPVKKIASHC